MAARGRLRWVSAWLLVGISTSVAPGCDKSASSESAAPGEGGSEGKRSLGAVANASRLVAQLETTASDACTCADRGCYDKASAAFDKLVADNADVKLDEAQVARAGAAAEKVLKCKRGNPAATSGAGTTPAAPSTKAEGTSGAAAEEPSDADTALAGLMSAVKARCGCKADDKVCAMSGDGQLATVLKGLEGKTFATPQEAIRRSLVFEAEECSGKTLSTGARAAAAATEGANAAAPDAEGQEYRRGKIAEWSQLPRTINGLKHLLAMGQKADSPYIDAVFGQTVNTVLRAFPQAEKMEFDDLEPNTTRVRLELAETDARGSRLTLEWRFLFGKLFMVTLHLKRTAPKLRGELERFLARAPDVLGEEDWKVSLAQWQDGNLLIRAAKDGKYNSFGLADRTRHELYTTRRKRAQEAYRANKLGLKALFSRPMSPHYGTAQKHFEDALAKTPSYGHAAVNLCRLLLLTGRLDDARTRCKTARDKSRNISVHAESALFTGMLANVAGDRASAEKWFNLARGYGADDESVERMARRHLKLMARKGNKRDYERPVRRVACATAEGDPRRARIIAKAYGYATAQALLDGAKDKGVNVERQSSRAAKRCALR